MLMALRAMVGDGRSLEGAGPTKPGVAAGNMRSGVTERAEGFVCQEDAADSSAATGGVAGEELLSCVCSAWSAQGEEIEQEVAVDIHGHGGCG